MSSNIIFNKNPSFEICSTGFQNVLKFHENIPQDVDGSIILRWIFGKLEGVVETGWSWFRIGTDGGLLWVR
jgi:hypothetical protein